MTPNISATVRRAFAIAGIATLSALALTACGEGEDLPATNAPPAAPGDAPAPPQEDPAAPGTDGGDADEPDNSALADLAQSVVDSNDRVTGYSVSGNTVTYTINNEDADGFEGVSDCLTLSARLEPSEKLVLEYPDRTVDCG